MTSSRELFHEPRASPPSAPTAQTASTASGSPRDSPGSRAFPSGGAISVQEIHSW